MPVGILVLIVAANGIRLGLRQANLDESAVISFYAERYLQDHARLEAAGTAALTDCAAVPGSDPGVWVVVRCSPEGGDSSWDYYIRRDGSLAFTGRDRAARPEA
ncbi:hypothetical protein [Tropicimonas sp. S265A]|uniref:hypothetical protein n=1 Tax=Tropicimonas sp. S265A TaxID=3415134 RepID=UPI003C7ABC46